MGTKNGKDGGKQGDDGTFTIFHCRKMGNVRTARVFVFCGADLLKATSTYKMGTEFSKCD